MSDCFDHMQDAWDDLLFGASSQTYGGEGYAPRPPRCKFCGSTDVRWRQQTGKWVLFSLQPGIEHRCRGPATADEFDTED